MNKHALDKDRRHPNSKYQIDLNYEEQGDRFLFLLVFSIEFYQRMFGQ